MSDFLSLRNSNRPKTQKEVDELMANEPDVLPAYGGAGSMMTHLKRAKSQYKPTDARARLTAAERAQFAAENQEPTQLSPEEKTQVFAEVDRRTKLHEGKEYLADAVRQNRPLEDAWRRKFTDECPLFAHVARDGDPTGAPQEQIIAGWKAFAESPVFASYYTADSNSPRGKVLGKVMDLLYSFMSINMVNMTLAQSWVTCFQLLQNIGVLPAPVPTSAQLQVVERNKPADDGNPVAMNDVTGEPATYTFKDGRVVRYSKQMLDKLNSESYAKVMGIRKSPVELQETEEQRKARKAHEYRTVVVAKGFTQKELDAMPSEKYREVMELSRASMAMKPFDRL